MLRKWSLSHELLTVPATVVPMALELDIVGYSKTIPHLTQIFENINVLAVAWGVCPRPAVLTILDVVTTGTKS
jgi:hypothetical protein